MSTEAQRRASAAYNRRRDNLMCRPSKEDGEAIRAAASAAGQSVQAYMLQAVRERMERETPPDPAGAAQSGDTAHGGTDTPADADAP